MFTLPWVIIITLVSEFCLVMFSSLSYTTSADTPARRCPFAKLSSLAHQLRGHGRQLRSDGPPVQRVIQDISFCAADPQSDTYTGRSLGKFNFGVGMRGVREGREG